VCFECLIGKQKKPILFKVTGRESGRRKREKDALWRKKEKRKKRRARVNSNGRPEQGATDGRWKESVCLGGKRKYSMRGGGRSMSA